MELVKPPFSVYPYWFFLFLWLILYIGCDSRPQQPGVSHLFTLMPESWTGVRFRNTISDESRFNVFKYRNYYNGGGVAIGDVNNDGLPDIYLTANREKNRLYINLGNFRFKDVTDRAGVGGTHQWATGVCMADVNADGLLDIYVCNSGNLPGDNRANELFLNQGPDENGVPRFREMAEHYGIADRGFSTHALFFDFDRDGDLDLYVLNNAFRPLSTFDLSVNLRNQLDAHGGGDHLYRNDGKTFTDVTTEAGISVIAFGLGVVATDFDNDGWPDLYVANDFFERDYLYLNQHDGTFREALENMLSHVSLSSMGMDVGDVNRDGWMDLFTADMLPEEDERLKTTFTFDRFDFLEKQVEWGYYHQYSQNALQINRGRSPWCGITFSDYAWFAGVAATDWTWGALLVDLDNDGWQDIFITNGIYRDVTNQDYIAKLMQRENIRKVLEGERINFPELIRQMPSTPLPNYAFQNLGNLHFTNQAHAWGLDTLSFSNGAAYGDLDLDGDNDLVVNNVNQPAFLFRNESDTLLDHHYLQVRLHGDPPNRFAVGTRITVYCPQLPPIVAEQMPMRGFQSSMSYLLTIGIGRSPRVDSIVVRWPDGRWSRVQSPRVDQEIVLAQSNAVGASRTLITRDTKPLLQPISDRFPLHYRHRENHFVDFQREPLIPHKLSTEGPALAVGDANGDGLEDVFLGGAKGQPASLFLQQPSGSFVPILKPLWQSSRISEDVDAAFFDADGDGDLDLYVVSGGNEFSSRSPGLIDRFYRNQGHRQFIQDRKALPRFYASGACVAPGDFDGDGDIDLFVGSRSVPWQYGKPPRQYLLQNDGRGHFTDVTAQVAPDLLYAGMVTDAEWLDVNRDGALDLVVVGEWMSVSVFVNDRGRLLNATAQWGLDSTQGWWNCLTLADVNSDGRIDLLAGNLGLNTKLQAYRQRPIRLYLADFDHNGMVDPILCYNTSTGQFPLPLLPDLLKQLPYLARRFPTHASYAGKPIEQLFTPQELAAAEVKQAYEFRSCVFLASDEGKFQPLPLPDEAQLAPVYTIQTEDFDGDGKLDLLLAGNFYGATPQLARFDASYGTLLRGLGNGRFMPMSAAESGLCIRGQVRRSSLLHHQRYGQVILFAQNNDSLLVYLPLQQKNSATAGGTHRQGRGE